MTAPVWVYVAMLIIFFAGGVAMGYLIREAKYWGEVADRYRAMRHGSQVR